MIEQSVSAIPLLFFNNLLPFDNLLHAISTRRGGLSSGPYSTLNLGLDTGDDTETVLKNYAAVSSALEFELPLLVAARQVHGTQVVFIGKEYTGRRHSPLVPPLAGYDALVTREPDITLIVRVADCVPIILFDPVQQAAAVVHAGWRGTLAGVAEQTVKELVERCHSVPEHILAGIGPSIGPCCCEVQEQVATLFRSKSPQTAYCIQETGNKLFLNLWEANRLQLVAQGIPAGNIEVAQLCTVCCPDLFFSYRREQGETGRFGAFVGLRR
jgi:hypothetical protein